MLAQTYKDAIAERRARQHYGKPIIAETPEVGANSEVVVETAKTTKKKAKKEAE